MRIGIVVLVCVLLGSCSTTKFLGTKDSLLSAHKYKNQLLVEGNTTGLKEIVHENLLYKHSNCWEEEFSGFTNPSHELDYHSIDIETVNTRILEEVGLVHGTANFNITYKEKDLSLWLCYIEHYVWRKDKWILISRHASKDTKERS